MHIETTAAPAPADPWLSYDDLRARGVVANRTTLARWIDKHGFPKPVALGPNTKRWRKSWIDAWEREREVPQRAA